MKLSELFDEARVLMKILDYKFNLTTCLAFMYLRGDMDTSSIKVCEKYFEKKGINMFTISELYKYNIEN